MTLTITMLCFYAECRYSECRVGSNISPKLCLRQGKDKHSSLFVQCVCDVKYQGLKDWRWANTLAYLSRKKFNDAITWLTEAETLPLKKKIFS